MKNENEASYNSKGKHQQISNISQNTKPEIEDSYEINLKYPFQCILLCEELFTCWKFIVRLNANFGNCFQSFMSYQIATKVITFLPTYLCNCCAD